MVLTVAIAVDLFGRMDRHVGTLGLEDACAEVMAGDSPTDVFERLGLDGYRPGCSDEAPCLRADFGDLKGVPYLCAGDDCSLYWRVADVGCLVEWRAGAPGVEGADILRLPR